MRKNTRNEKVLRAITIGLAAMISVTSMPVTAFAEDGVTPAAPDNGEHTGEEKQSVSDAVSHVENAENIITGSSNTESEAPDEPSQESQAEPETPNEPSQESQAESEQPGCLPAIETAIVEVADIPEASVPMTTEGIPSDDESAASINDDLNTAGDLLKKEQINENGETESEGALAFLKEAEDNFALAQEKIDEAEKEDSTYNNNINLANANLTIAEGKTSEYNNVDKDSINKNSDEAIANAEVANTSDDRDTAVNAKNGAEADLSAAQDGLNAATEAYNAASEAVELAEDEYNTAKGQLEEAEKLLENANAAVENAKGNADAAKARLAEAQAKVNALTNEVNELAEKKSALEEMQDQYYKAMIHFYRDPKILNYKGAVYNEDGTIDLEASAKKAIGNADESSRLYNTSGLSDNTMALCRELMKELIMYKLEADGVDKNTVEFALEGGKEKDAGKGNIIKDSTKVNDKVEVELTDKQKWDDVSGDSGRNNHVTVKYPLKDENGDPVIDEKTGEVKMVTEYYNYIFKSLEYGDFTGENAKDELAKGPIYLARVEEVKDENGKRTGWTSYRDTSDNNLDNYLELLKAYNAAVEAGEKRSEYEAAKRAVDAAVEEVERLQAELDNIKKVSVDFSTVDALEKRLNAAKTELAEKEKEKNDLEDKVDQAQAAVEGIDLSRFDVTVPVNPPIPSNHSDEAPENTDNTDEEQNKEDESNREEESNKEDENNKEDESNREDETNKEDENTDNKDEEEQGGSKEDEPLTDDSSKKTEEKTEKDKKDPVTPLTASPVFEIFNPATPNGPSNDLSDGPVEDVREGIPGGIFDATPFDGSPVTAPETPIFPISPIGGGVGISPAATAGIAGIMEAIEGTGAEYVNEDGTTADEEKAGDLKAAKDAVKPADKDKKIIKNIDDQEVPLAAIPQEEGVRIVWWWLLIILLLGATGRKMYENYQEKKRIKAEAESNNRNE